MSIKPTALEPTARQPIVQPKKPYRAPTLVVFGQVAALTRSGNCSAHDDGSASCSLGSAGMVMLSDRRLKQAIVRIGEHPRGFGVYLFEYQNAERFGRRRHFGVMADEIEKIEPAAVLTGEDGYKLVDYARLGIIPHLQ